MQNHAWVHSGLGINTAKAVMITAAFTSLNPEAERILGCCLAC